MTIKLASLADDLAKERDGEWIEVGEWPGLDSRRPGAMIKLPGLGFRVRSTLFPAFVTARQEELERIRKLYPDNTAPADELAKVDGLLAVQHLLLEWRGLDTAYTPEAAEQTLLAEEYRKLRDMIYWCAARVGKRDVEFLVDATKNSDAPSA